MHLWILFPFIFFNFWFRPLMKLSSSPILLDRYLNIKKNATKDKCIQAFSWNIWTTNVQNLTNGIANNGGAVWPRHKNRTDCSLRFGIEAKHERKKHTAPLNAPNGIFMKTRGNESTRNISKIWYTQYRFGKPIQKEQIPRHPKSQASSSFVI